MLTSSPRSLVLIVLLFALAVVGTWFFTLGVNETRASAVEPPVAEVLVETEQQSSEMVVAPEPSEPDEASRAAVDVADALESKAHSAIAIGEVPVLLEGRLIIEELDGSQTTNASGKMGLVLWLAGSGSSFVADVQDGHWVALASEKYLERLKRREQSLDQVLASGELAAEHFESGDARGSAATVGRSPRFALGIENVVVTMRRTPAAVLNVTDAATGEHLNQIDVRALRGMGGEHHSHPGDSRMGSVLASGASSPIEIDLSVRDARRGFGSVIVGSEGYAWTNVDVDFATGGTYDVSLERGGDLELFLSRAPEQPEAVLRLRRAEDWRVHAEMGTRRGGPYVFVGLAPGSYEVSLEVGDWWGEPLVLGQGVIAIEEGASETLTLELIDAPEYNEAELAGTLIVPMEWEVDEPSLMLKLLDTPLNGKRGIHHLEGSELVQLDGRPGVYSFDFGMVQTGRYSLNLRSPQYAIGLTLDVNGDRNVIFAIPPPVEISVLLRDVSTGNVAEVEELRWHCKRPEGVRGGSLSGEKREPGTERFRFLVPRCEITLNAGGGAWVSANKNVQATAGASFEIDLTPAAQGVVILKHGEETVPWSGEFYDAIKSVDGEGYLCSMSGTTFSVSEEGRYRLTIPKAQGYEQHDPVEFDMVNGELLEIVVRLTRTP